MAILSWDNSGAKLFETGVDHGVLYVYDSTNSTYAKGVAWNGLTAVTESPSGAEATGLYADNIKYLNLVSAEEFGATIEAYTYPDEFAECNGEAELTTGARLGQQERKTFALCYRTKIGSDTDGNNHGYKLHLIYGALAAPSEKAYSSVNDSPEAITFSWEISTTPVPVTVNNKEFKPTSYIVVDSTKATDAGLKALEDKLYGTAGTGSNGNGTDPTMPMPDEVYTLLQTTGGTSG